MRTNTKTATRVATNALIADNIAEYTNDDVMDDIIPRFDEICIYNIPPDTKRISCSGQCLEGPLSINLPQSLVEFDCSNNQITELPAQLPPNLTLLDCSNNNLTRIPYNLPQKLEYLICENNKLTQLPACVTDHANITICCANNSIVVLPDMPLTLSPYSDFAGNPLDDNYPLLFAIYHTAGIQRRGRILAKYINECNAERRKCELQYNMATFINPQNVLLERYMRRMLHPAHFAQPLLHDENIDVDDFITQYVDAL